ILDPNDPASTLLGLFLDRLQWDSSSGTLKLNNPTDQPIRIGEDHFKRPGYSLWVGYSQQKLYIVVQSIHELRSLHRVERLTPITELEDHVDLYPLFGEKVNLSVLIADLSDITSWRFQIIDRGGYDLDVMQRDNYIYCIYRRNPYSLLIDDSQKINPNITTEEFIQIPSDIFIDEPYFAPLFIKRIDLTTNAIEDPFGTQGIPGGEHPQIQNIDPFLVTIERPRGGLRIIPADTETGSIRVSPFILFYLKILILKTQTGWARGDLFSFPYSVIPRNFFHEERWFEHQNRHNISGSVAYFSTVYGYLPMFYLGLKEMPMLKGSYIDFLHHSYSHEALQVSRFLIAMDNVDLKPQNYGCEILDINHSQLSSSPPAENHQFGPTVVWLADRFDDIDNTLGGALVKDTTSERLNFFAYVDLGDRGLRVIFDAAFPPPEPSIPSIDVKWGIDPELVNESGSSQDDLITLDIEGWSPSNLPHYDNSIASFMSDASGSLGSGLNVLLDTLASLVSIVDLTQPLGTNPITVTRKIAEDIETLFMLTTDLWDLFWDLYDTVSTILREEDGITVRIHDHKLSLSKYTLEYFFEKNIKTGELEPNRVIITTNEFHDTQFCLMNGIADTAQGLIDYRFKIIFSSDDLNFKAYGLEEFFNADSVSITLYYSRWFTPGILMSERRDGNPSEVVHNFQSREIVRGEKGLRPAVLTTKPISSTKIDTGEIKVTLKWTWVGGLTLALISLIATSFAQMGLFALARQIDAYITGLELAMFVGNIGAIIAIYAAILVLFTITVPRILGNEIAGRVRTKILEQNQNIKNELDGQPLMWYAGEGLAEAIATLVHEKVHQDDPTFPLEVDGKGRNRFREQFWQRIFVTTNRCKVLIRK
ncbi:MAG: hypothetical protein ACFFC6_17415, partial [Promethearchaeota archaeon]